MTHPPPAGASGGFGCVGSALFASVLGGSMLVLVTVLTQECSAGDEALTRYVSEVRSGAAVDGSVGGGDAEALTWAMRESTGLTITNFQAQHGTSCYWATLSGPRPVEVRFVLEESGEERVVRAASLTRECVCPEDADRSCHLR